MKGKGVKLALLALSAAVLVFCVFALSSGFANEISHVHGFRQAQTLVAIRQMLSGGPWVFYELPVMGEPIRLPHEFPLFDWLVIALARFGGGSPLVCARIISLIFWIGTIPVSVQILRIAGASRITRLVFLLLYLNCPLYQHWSHAAMGETMVLFFTLSLILCASISKERNSQPIQAVGLVSGILAGMAKSLILFSYALPLAWILLNGGRMRRNHRSVILFFVAPIFAAVSWTLLADQWKNKNLIAAKVLASKPLLLWMMGSLEEKLSFPVWHGIWERAFTDALGSPWLLIGITALTLIQRNRPAAFLILCGLLPVTILSSIYSTHYYYACAVTIEWIAAAAFVLGSLLQKSSPRNVLGFALLLLILCFQSSRFLSFYYPLQTIPNQTAADYGRVVREVTKNDEVPIVYGWSYSPETTYFSGRETITNPESRSLKDPVMAETIQRTQPLKPGPAIFCLSERDNKRLITEAISMLDLDPTPLRHRYADCRIYIRKGRERPISSYFLPLDQPPLRLF